MRRNWITRGAAVAVTAGLAAMAAGCGEYVRNQGRAPAQLVITELLAAAGEDGETGNTLLSDVITKGSVFNDNGSVAMRLIMKNPDASASPSPLNTVTINRYRVEYQRADGRNEPGRDVPHGFDSAVTFTVTESGGSAGFQLVRHAAKQEAPLAALAANGSLISTIATVSFYGRDQAGNEVSVSGNIGIDFGNFADPD